MTDDRGRKRDTPDGVFGQGTPNKKVGHVPRGAGLSGSLPGNSRYASQEPAPGSVPITIQNEPRRIRDREVSEPHEPRRAYDPYDHEPPRGGRGDQWDAAPAPPPSRRPPEPPPPRSPAPHRPQTVRGVDGFAATRPAEPVPSRGPNMSTLDPQIRSPRPAASARPNERSGPPRAPEGKTSLRLKLEGDTYYEANVGRVRVPKRRGPMLLGVLLVLGMLVGGAWLWIDGHGGVTNFVAALRHVVDPDSPDPNVQTSVSYGDSVQGQAPAAAPGAQPSAQPAATPPAQPSAAGPGAQPAAAPQQPAAAEAKPEQPGQIATGEIDVPEEQPAAGAKPANETRAKPEQPAEAKPKPKPPVAAAKPKPKPAVHRDPVLKVQPLGDVLNAAPPDPSGAAVLPPPDPPAPE